MIRTLNTSAHKLEAVADGTVQMIATSPPYYGLRSYAGDQDVEWPTVTFRLNEWCEPVTVEPMRCALGLEPSPVAYIGHLILCLREWRRVLRDDGVCFVNLGDSYASNWGMGADRKSSWWSTGSGELEGKGWGAVNTAIPPNSFASKPGNGPKVKDLLGIPWLFAIAARADGWWLRSDIIWSKPNPMPESVTDRPTKAHEYIFLLAKSARYYWDADAVKEDATNAGKVVTLGEKSFSKGQANGAGIAPSGNGTADSYTVPSGRNIRTVWNIATAPYPGAHYAVFPERLVEPMIKAATSERGCCPSCGAPWRRVVEKQIYKVPVEERTGRVGHNGQPPQQSGWYWTPPETTTTGWTPTCDCDTGEPMPCIVLDPFAGSGTTGRVAVRLGRHAILVDVSAEYLSDHVPARTTVQMEMLA